MAKGVKKYPNAGFHEQGDGVWIPCFEADVDTFDRFRVLCMVTGVNERDLLIKWMERYIVGFEHLLRGHRLLSKTLLILAVQKHFGKRIQFNIKNIRYFREKWFVEGKHFWQSQLKTYKNYVYDCTAIIKLFEDKLRSGELRMDARGRPRKHEFGAMSVHLDDMRSKAGPRKRRKRTEPQSGRQALGSFRPDNT